MIAAVLALALLGTVAGQLIYFRMIYSYGSARASLVVYLLPVTALIYGAVLLGETVTTSALAGLVLILTGTALGSGLLRLRRRRRPGLAVNDVVLGDGFRLRRADIDDVDFLAELAGHDDVEPFLSVRRARDPHGVREEIQRSLAEPGRPDGS